MLAASVSLVLVAALAAGCTARSDGNDATDAIASSSGPASVSTWDTASRSAVTALSDQYPSLAYIGSVPSSDEQPPTLYFLTELQPVDSVVALGRTLAVEDSATVAPGGFDLCVLGAGGKSVVSVRFSGDAAKNVDWPALARSATEREEEDYWSFFKSATSYEWFDLDSWKTLVREPGDDRAAIPTAQQLPAARWDERSMRRLAAGQAFAPASYGPSMKSSVKVTGTAQARTVTLTYVDNVAVGVDFVGNAADMGATLMPRLALDPTISSVELVFADSKHDVLRVRYARPALERPLNSDDPLVFLRRSTSYRWLDESQWKTTLEQWSLTQKELPRSKQGRGALPNKRFNADKAPVR